mmetsp:Transcript_10937/g.42368  ORF Transcript_10937/g.42368 Transcript_10937/m.42368 type:complete len:235 (-) Transcript_10937:426-1130(-)
MKATSCATATAVASRAANEARTTMPPPTVVRGVSRPPKPTVVIEMAVMYTASGSDSGAQAGTCDAAHTSVSAACSATDVNAMAPTTMPTVQANACCRSVVLTKNEKENDCPDSATSRRPLPVLSSDKRYAARRRRGSRRQMGASATTTYAEGPTAASSSGQVPAGTWIARASASAVAASAGPHRHADPGACCSWPAVARSRVHGSESVPRRDSLRAGLPNALELRLDSAAVGRR